jgi:hypothetical protein
MNLEMQETQNIGKINKQAGQRQGGGRVTALGCAPAAVACLRGLASGPQSACLTCMRSLSH